MYILAFTITTSDIHYIYIHITVLSSRLLCHCFLDALCSTSRAAMELLQLQNNKQTHQIHSLAEIMTDWMSEYDL